MNLSLLSLHLKNNFNLSPFYNNIFFLSNKLKIDYCYFSKSFSLLINLKSFTNLTLKSSNFLNFLNQLINIEKIYRKTLTSISSLSLYYDFIENNFQNISSTNTNFILIDNLDSKILFLKNNFFNNHFSNSNFLIYIPNTNNITIIYTCFLTCSSLLGLIGISSHTNNIPYSSMNFSSEINSGNNIQSTQSSFIGGRLKFTYFYNNHSLNSATTHRCSFCFVQSNSGELGGYCQNSYCKGKSFFAPYFGSPLGIFHHFNFINNTILSGGGWIEIGVLETYCELTNSYFINNFNNCNWIHFTTLNSKIYLTNCFFTNYPINSSIEIIYNNNLTISNFLNTYSIITIYCWNFDFITNCQFSLPNLFYRKFNVILFFLFI